jgi:hypothetical protein
MEVRGQHHTVATLPPGNSPNTHAVSESQGWSGCFTEQNNLFLLLPGFQHRHYTDDAILAHISKITVKKN